MKNEPESKLGKSSFIPYPHGREPSNAHETKQNNTRSSTSKAQYPRDQKAINIGLAQGRCNGESSDKEHNSWREHRREDESTTIKLVL
jgi:hypothetical protein